MKFYEVVAKCGHVGKKQYFEGHFFIRADSGSLAAQKAKQMPRVKRDHKDAILSVIELDYATFSARRIVEQAHPYYLCSNVWQQRRLNLEDRLYDEPRFKEKVSRKTEPDSVVYSGKTKVRNPLKYFNRYHYVVKFNEETYECIA